MEHAVNVLQIKYKTQKNEKHFPDALQTPVTSCGYCYYDLALQKTRRVNKKFLR